MHQVLNSLLTLISRTGWVSRVVVVMAGLAAIGSCYAAFGSQLGWPPFPDPSQSSPTPIPEEGARTKVILKPVDDAYVRGGEYADENFGKALELDVKSDSEPSYERFAFLKFDMETIQGEVEEAQLVLCPRWVGPANNLLNEAVLIPNTTWNENDINWNVRPAFSNTVLSSWMPTLGKFVETNVTPAAREAMLGNKKFTIGVRGTGTAEPEDDGDVRYYSKEDHSNVRPRLEVTVRVPPSVIIPTVTPLSPSTSEPANCSE